MHTRKVATAFFLLLLVAGIATGAAAAPPSAPDFIEPNADGALAHPGDVHMEIEGFSDSDGDSHQCTDWKIEDEVTNQVVWKADCAKGFLRMHIHLPEGTFTGALAGKTQLLFSRNYSVHSRFVDSDGSKGAWAVRSFRTYDPEPPGDPKNSWQVEDGYELERFAGGFSLPVNIAFVPNPRSGKNAPYFYVTELYGDVKLVTRSGRTSTFAHGLVNFDPSSGGFSSGEAGLSGIVVDPKTGDVFVTVVYAGSPQGGETPVYGKVLRLKSRDGGHTAAEQELVLDVNSHSMADTSHQISRISIGPDGKLYVHVGEGHAGGAPQSLDSYLGKILRLNRDGSAPKDNPFYNAGNGIGPADYVFTRGFRNPYGGDWRAADEKLYVVENGPSIDRLSRQDAGKNYGWALPGVDNNEVMKTHAVYNWQPAVAPVNGAWVQPETFGGSGFPNAKQGHLFVTISGNTGVRGPNKGKRIHELVVNDEGTALDSGPTSFVVYKGTGLSNTVALAAGPDGLYFSEFFKPDAPDAAPWECCSRIFRVRHKSTPPIRASNVGTAGSDRMDGGPAADRLRGRGGNDVLRGFGGNDVLNGGSGNDRVLGGVGSDRLFGSRGRDRLWGGGGPDVLRIRGGGRDVAACGRGKDRVVADRRDRVGKDCEIVERG